MSPFRDTFWCHLGVLLGPLLRDGGLLGLMGFACFTFSQQLLFQFNSGGSPRGIVKDQRRDLDGLLQGLSNPEAPPLARLDRNRGSRVGVSAHPGLAFLHFEGTEPCEGHGAIGLQSLSDPTQDGVDEVLRLESRCVQLLSNVSDQVAFVHFCLG